SVCFTASLVDMVTQYFQMAFCVCVAAGSLCAADYSGLHPQNVIVYRAAARYGGWPANHGIWHWGNEIVVGFEAGYFKYNERTHSIDWDRPAEHLLARSLDGGETWKVEHPLSLRAPDGTKQANVPSERGGKAITDCPGGINFANPNFALTARFEDVNA